MRTMTLAAICLFTCLLPDSLRAQEPQSPGPEHKELAELTGTWDATLKMADGAEVKGESIFKVTCGGMWLESDFHVDFGGLKFHGKGLDGYDAAKKQYVAVWVDSMSGTPMIMHGTKEGKVTTMVGEGAGPQGVAKYKTITTNESADRMSFKMMMLDGEKEQEMMTITYTRHDETTKRVKN